MTTLHAAVIHTKPGRSAKDYVSIDPITLYNKTTFPSGLCLDYNKYFQSSHQIDIVRELVEKYPTMIKETDIQGWTALHYAAHIGHTKAIKLLMDRDSSLAYLKTNEGMSALHIAAMAGHVDVTREIIRRQPDACYVLDNVHQTFLHVAVKHTRSAVVAYIVKNWKLEGVLNVGDENGNTPLHLAAISGLNLAAISVWYLAAIYSFRFSQQYKILKSLARDIRVDKKIMNNEHLTAIDIVIANEQTLNSTKNMIIKALKQGGSRQSLEGVMGKKNGEEINTIYSNQMKNYETEFEHLNHISATHLLVATLIATVTFAAGLTVPGGYFNSGDKEGTPVLISKSSFKAFIFWDSLAFSYSMASILLYFWASTVKNYDLCLRLTASAAILVYLSLIVVVGAFYFGLSASIPNPKRVCASNCIGLLVLLFGLYMT